MSTLRRDPMPLRGRTALVTGGGRRGGTGVNPGPVDTGYLGAEAFRAMAPMFPFGRFGEPDDPARLIAWLCTDEAAWITGQVIDSEGGFARHRNGWRPW